MIPDIPILTEEIPTVTYPNRTYKITNDGYRISGYVNDLEAVKQAVYLILSTERYKHIIYSWDYGIELLNLYGKPIPYVMVELPRRVKDALIQDNRIEDVVDFKFEHKGKKLHATFTVVCNVGSFSTALEVDV